MGDFRRFDGPPPKTSSRCLTMAMVGVPQLPETADVETSSDGYARRFSGKVGAWFLQVQESASLRMLAPYRGASILDVGGGHGQLTGALIRNGYAVTVLGSDGTCSKRIQNYIDEGSCSFDVGNIVDMPYADEAFDVVVSYRLISHVGQWKQLISELTRVARQAVIIDFPPTRSLNAIAPLLFPFKKRIEGNTRVFTCFNESRLSAEFVRRGFSPVERYPEFFAPMVLHRVLRRPSVSSATERVCRAVGLTSLLGSPVILKLVREGG